MPRQGVSQREMAAAAGVSLYALQRAIKAGRITPLSDGSFDREAGLIELRQKTDPTKNRGTRAAQVVEASVPAADPEGPAASYDDVRRKLESGAPMDFMEARTASEVLKARHALVKLDEASGALVSFAEYQKLREVENQVIKDRMRAVPQSMAERVIDAVHKGALAPEVAALLLQAIDEALEALANAEVKAAA